MKPKNNFRCCNFIDTNIEIEFLPAVNIMFDEDLDCECRPKEIKEQNIEYEIASN